jgi:cyanamide hydratase
MSQADEVQLNGWHAVPLDPSKMFDNRPFNHEPRAHAADVVQFPTHDSVVKYVYDYAKQQLPWQTFNHSMRVYYYGRFHTCWQENESVVAE